jgi:hypothetical protein
MTLTRRLLLPLLRLWLRYAAWRFRRTPEYRALVAEQRAAFEAWMAARHIQIERIFEREVRR